MSDFGLNEAVSQANSLTSSVGDHNDMVRGFQQGLKDKLATTLTGIQSDQHRDQILHGVEQVYGVGSALKSGVSTYGEIQDKGVGQFMREQGEHAKSVGRGMLGMGEAEEGATAGRSAIGAGLSKIGRLATTPTPSSFTPRALTGPLDEAVRGARTEQLTERTARGTGAADAVEGTSVTQDLSKAARIPSKIAVVPEGAASSVGTARNPRAPSSSPPEGATQAGEGTQTLKTAGKGDQLLSSGDDLANRVLGGIKSAGETAGKVATVAGVATAGYDVFEDFKHHGIAGDNTAEKVSNVTGIVSGALDVASIFLPFLAPVAAATTAASGIAGFVGEEQEEGSKTGAAGQAKTAEAKSASAEKVVSAPSLAMGGLIASAQTNNKASIVPTSGSF